MTLFSQAIAFAAQMHSGAFRKGTDIPYIVHPMEAAAIAATITTDDAVLAAAVLHDVIEDCGVSAEELETRFGGVVAGLVLSETQLSIGDPKETWESRKREGLRAIGEGSREVRIIALGDKLSNMRAISRDYHLLGGKLFDRFNQHDPRMHAWYYRSCQALFAQDLADTQAYAEFCMHVENVFGRLAPLDQGEDAFAV